MTIINTILIILILISAAYFGGSYFLEGKGINIGSIFKSFAENIKDKQGKQNKPDESKKPQPSTDTPSSSNEESKQPVEKTNAYYEYKSSDGKLYKLEYTEVLGSKEFIGVKNETGEVQFDISSDRKKVVFCSMSGDVVLGDDTGVIKKINTDSYRSKSSGITIEKQTTFKYYPDYIWAAKPHFTSDNRVVYITFLPYLKDANTFYMWVLSIDGSSNRMVGMLTNDINKIIYDGFSSDGALRIKVNDTIFYLPSGEYRFTK
jgi:hypothetical protein